MDEAATPSALRSCAAEMRAALAHPLEIEETVAALAAGCEQIASIGNPIGAETVQSIAHRWGWSEEVLELSLRALCEPVKRPHLEALAQRISSRKELIAFVMAGNIPGAGLHEVILALLTGHGVIIKTASNEPVFFRQLAEAVRQTAPALAARIAVFTWERHDQAQTSALREICDRMVVFGDDQTIAHPSLAGAAGGNGQTTGFGSRYSGAILTSGAIAGSLRGRILHPLVLDIIAFEQRGCLSPHHIFVGDPEGSVAEEFAASLAAQIEAYSDDVIPPPSQLALEDTASIRRMRERARWRRIGGEAVHLWEGPIPGWTVIYDRDASFTPSPGFRTVFVSPFRDAPDLERRLVPVKGQIEGMAFKAEPTIESESYIYSLRHLLEQTGATYISEPGRMQSPSLDWPHGGGEFWRSLCEKA